MQLLRRSTARRLLLAAVVGLVAAAGAAVLGDGRLATMVGITVGEAVFVVVTWSLLWPMDAAATREGSQREDFVPVLDELLISTVSALAVIAMISLRVAGETHVVGAVLVLLGVFGAWACVHQTYALHYAAEYYRPPVGGIDFGPEDPGYSDFVYFSYAVGMTYGATDNTVTTRHARAIVLRHALTSFVFGLLILGAAVDLVSGAFGLG